MIDFQILKALYALQDECMSAKLYEMLTTVLKN
jgi:hypothetical protein